MEKNGKITKSNHMVSRKCPKNKKKTLILTFKSKVIMKIKTYVKFKSLEGFSATFGDLGLL